MNGVIEREYRPDCTLGFLTLDNGARYATIERPRTGDHPCIPEGEYVLRPHESPHFGPVYAFVGLGVWEWQVPPGEAGRCLILLHPANLVSELLGCIAPGMSHGHLGQYDAVLNSREAFSAIRDALGREETHLVTIREAA